MSEIRVTNIIGETGLDAVNFTKGINVSSGVVTATTFSGSGASLTSLPAGNLTGALPAISGAALTGISATVKQIKSANFTSQFAFSNNSSFTASNITVDITPTSASSKILVFGSTNIYKSGDSAQVCTTIYRDSTNLGVSPLYGFGEFTVGAGSLNWVGIYNDSPNTTSQITYKIYTRVQSGHNGALGANNVPTNITAIEYST